MISQRVCLINFKILAGVNSNSGLFGTHFVSRWGPTVQSDHLHIRRILIQTNTYLSTLLAIIIPDRLIVFKYNTFY